MSGSSASDKDKARLAAAASTRAKTVIAQALDQKLAFERQDWITFGYSADFPQGSIQI